MKITKIILIISSILTVFNMQISKAAEKKTASESIPIESHSIPFEIIEEGNIKKIQEALNNGLNVNEKYKDGYYNNYTPLAVAISNRRGAKAEVVELLLKNNANVNERFFLNETPLMRVSFYGFCDGYLKIVRLLIENGADINAQDDKGNTALHNVTHIFNQNKSEILKLLLIYGADINIKNNAGKNFIDYTFDYDMEETRTQILKIVNEFIEKKLKNRLFEGIENNNFVSVFEILYDNPQMINEKNEIGETVLSQAILFGRFSIIKELFENPNIEIKPNLLEGQITKGLYNVKNQVEYAQQLGRPGCDPAKKIYRDIAAYLREQRDLQEALQTKTNEK